MKRSRVLPLVLLLAASVSMGATRTTVMHRVRQQSAAALRSIREEVKSWMAVMRRGATGTRKGIAGAGASITRGGRQAIDGVKGTAQYLGRETRRQVHDTMTLVAREFVPVGEHVTVRAESTAPMAVPSPISEPAFLRAHDIQLAWHITTAGRDIRQSLLMDANLLLEDLGNDIYALDPRNGIANWVFPLPARSMYDLTEGDETIAVVANDVLYDLDRDVGLPRIRFVLPFPTASQPALYGDSVILGSADDRIYSLNRKDRTREWSYLATGHVFAGVAVKANTVYFGQTNGKVFAYQPGSRRPMWEYTADDAVMVRLVADGDNLYFPAHDLFVHALNRLGGFRVWKFPVRGKVTQPVWAESETIYFAADGDGFYAVDRDKGEQLWFVRGGKWPVAVGQKNIYLEGPDQTILCVSRDTGKEQWRVSAKPFTHFVRNTTTDYIYLVTNRGQVHALYLRGDHIEKKKTPVKAPIEAPGPAKPSVEEPAAEPRPATEPAVEPEPAAEPEPAVEPEAPAEEKPKAGVPGIKTDDEDF